MCTHTHKRIYHMHTRVHTRRNADTLPPHPSIGLFPCPSTDYIRDWAWSPAQGLAHTRPSINIY